MADDEIVPNAELPAVKPVTEPPPVTVTTPPPAGNPFPQGSPPPTFPGVTAPALLPSPPVAAAPANDDRDDLTKAFDIRMDALAFQREAMLKTSMADALKADPTKEAKVLALSAASGIAPELVRDNFDDVERAVNFKGANLPAMQQAHPELAQWLTDRSNAAVGHDDLEALKRISFVGAASTQMDPATVLLPPGFIFSRGKIVEPLPNGQTRSFDTFEQFARDMQLRGYVDASHQSEVADMAEVLKSRFGTTGANLIVGAGAAMLPVSRFLPGGDTHEAENADVIAAATSLAPGFGGMLTRGVGGLIGSLPLLVAGGPTAELGTIMGEAKATQLLLTRFVGQRAAAFIGKESLPSMGAFAPMAIPGAIQTAQQKGLGAGALDFFINDAIPSAMGFGPVARALLPGEVPVATGYRSVAEQIAKGAGFQAAQGMAPVLATALADRAAGNVHAFDDLVPQLAATGLLGAGMGTLFGAGPAFANKFHVEHQANIQALNWGDHLRMWVDGLKDSAVTERTPERMAQYTQEFIARGAPEAVFMQHDDWAAAHPGLDPLQAAQNAGLEQAYADAKTLGIDMKVPLATFLQSAAASDKPEAFTHMAKETPGAPKPIDAAKAIVAAPEQIAEAQRLAQQEAAKAEPQTIREDVAGQLKGATSQPRIIGPASKLVGRGLERIAQMFNEGATERGAKPVTAAELYNEFKLEIQKGAPDFLREIVTPEALNSLIDKVRAGTAPEGAAKAFADLGLDLGKHPTNDTARGALAEALKPKGATLEQAPRLEPQGNDLDFKSLVFQWRKALGDRTMSESRRQWLRFQEQAALKNSEPANAKLNIAKQDLRHLSDKARLWVETLGAKDRALLFDSIEHLYKAPDRVGDLANLKWVLDLAHMGPRPKKGASLGQDEHANITFDVGRAVVRLFQSENPTSFLHESGHYFLEAFARVAERADAPEAMKQDLQNVMSWTGYGDRQTMKAKQSELADLQREIGEGQSTDAQRAKLKELSDPHEKFARGFEQYLMEGKAPAAGLRSAFAKIKEWMLSVYRGIKELVSLTPPMRDFFDRLLASEDEIAKARERVGDEPLFKSAEDFPGKPEEFAAYQRTVAEAQASQEQALERHLMRAALEERSDLYKSERAKAHEGFAAQVGEQPEFRALSALQDGELPNGESLPKELEGIKLNKDVLDHDYTPEELMRLPGPGKDVNRGKPVYAREGGWLPETAAAKFGFRSGDELVRALMDAPDRETLVDQLTDDHMNAQHPDAMKDRAMLEQLASESLTTDKAGDVLEDELRRLALKVGSNAQLRQVYRVAAQTKISEQSERELAPNQYRQGEAKAAREAQVALAKGDFAAALGAGKRRLMNRELFKAASEAKREAADIAANQRRFDEPRVQRAIGKAGGLEWSVRTPDGKVQVVTSQEEARALAKTTPGATYDRSSSYLDQIQKLRERFDFKNQTPAELERRQSLFQFLESIEYYTDPETGEKAPLGPHPIISDALRDEAYKRNWRDLPVEQLRDLNDAITSIEKTAMWRNKALAATAGLHIDELVRVATDTIQANKSYDRKITRVGIGPFDARTVLDAKDSLIQVPRIVHEMDGFKHGGKMWEVWQRPQDDAIGRRIVLDDQNTKALAEAMKDWGKKFGLHIQRMDDAIGVKISTWGRIMLLLHYGNKEGRQRVTSGYGWSDDQVKAVLSKLDAKDIRFAERVVDTLNSHWSDVKAQYEKLNGVAPPKVEAVPVELPAGTYKGGYMRLYYDRDSMVGYNHLGADEAKQALQGTRMVMQTRNGYTKERAKTLEGAKPSLDPMDIPRAMREVTHDLTHREMLMDLSRVLANKDFQGAVSSTWGPGVLRQMKYQLQGVAAGNQPPAIVLGKMLEGMRQKYNFAMRALRPVKALEQIAGLPLAIPQVGAGYFAKAVAQRFWSAVTFDRMSHAIETADPMMAARSKLINRSPQDVFGATGLEGPVKQVMNTAGYFLWSKTFQVMDEVVWMAAHNRALDEGHDAASAVAVAGRTVKSTMGSGEQTDLPQVMRGGPLGQIITANMSWALTNYNMLAEAANQTGHGFRKGDWGHIGKGLGSLVFLGIVGPALYEYSRDLLYGEDVSDWATPKGFAKETGLAGISGILSSLPLGRDLMAPAVEGKHYSGPAGMREMNVLGSFLTALHAQHYGEATAKAGVGAAALTLPIPAAAIFQIYDSVRAAKEQRQTPGQTARNFLLGPPSKRTR